jgi:hypothetical protein
MDQGQSNLTCVTLDTTARMQTRRSEETGIGDGGGDGGGMSSSELVLPRIGVTSLIEVGRVGQTWCASGARRSAPGSRAACGGYVER